MPQLMRKYITFMENKLQKNVLGENLELCSNNPLTGWYRDGCCNTDENDHGLLTAVSYTHLTLPTKRIV